MHQHSQGRGHERKQATTVRPAQDELPGTLADVEECVARLKKHVHDASLPQSIRRKIQTVHAAVQSLRANVDSELVHIRPTTSPPERSEFNCVEIAMEKLQRRIRADNRKRIVMDSDATESEPEQVVGPSVPIPLVKMEDPTVKDERSGAEESATTTVAKKKRKRIIRMNGSSDEGGKAPPHKVKVPPLLPPHNAQQPYASDTETDDNMTTTAPSPASRATNDQNSTTSPSTSKIALPRTPSADVIDKLDGGDTSIQEPATPPPPRPPLVVAKTRHDPSTYSGDSSDDEIATPTPFAASAPPQTKPRTPPRQPPPPSIPSAAPPVAPARSPSRSTTGGAAASLVAATSPALPTQRSESTVHAWTNHVDMSISDDDDVIEHSTTTPPPKALDTTPNSVRPPGPSNAASQTFHASDKKITTTTMPPPPPSNPPTTLSDALVASAIDISSTDSSDDSSDESPPRKRVSVWHTTPMANANAASSSDDDASSSDGEDAAAAARTHHKQQQPPPPTKTLLASPHRGPLWPNLDKFIGMLVHPTRPRLLPHNFIFPKAYASVAHYMSGLQQAIVEECLCAFANHPPPSRHPPLATVTIAAVSTYNPSLQSVLFRLTRPKPLKAASSSMSSLLQSHDLLVLYPSSALSHPCKKNKATTTTACPPTGIPAIALSTSLTQDDLVVLVSHVHSIDTLASFDVHVVGNLTTGSREYQAALSLSSWPASLQTMVTSAVVPTSASLGVLPLTLIPSLQQHFNQHQFQAIQRAIHQPMTLIQGPPGTGKTHTQSSASSSKTIIFISMRDMLRSGRALLRQPSSRRAKISVGAALGVNTQPNIRLLVTAPSNAAVNVIMHKIQAQMPDVAMVRLGQPTSPSLVWLEHLIDHDKAKNVKGHDWSSQEARERLLDGAQIVFCTLSGAGSWSMWNPKRSHFDAVIVDEAAQATEASSLIPLRFCAQRYIWVGDHKQLPATIMSTRLCRMEYDHSLFQRLVNNPVNHVVLLREQYRMHPDISSLPSRLFYSNVLVNARRDPPDTPYHAAGFPPYMFYDVTDGLQSRVETSYRNVPEVTFIASRLGELLKVPYDFKNKIGIISPYKSQIEAIKDALHAAKLTKAKIEVNTVDGFQGREKEIIIVSCVRTLRSGDNSFWGDVRRMNVSLTRAISSCWIVGNSNLLKESPAWAELLDDSKRRNVYQKVVIQPPTKVIPPPHAP
ncbi:hypothetical protein, variant [Aphanomyces astaci]|uniref:AAA+ ATPase domain-containing protein n=1 Tax=Aphanomyces astaci TaxID=112090 RepID=W4GB70_APHAT|nr:hypothetical protein, variant [Aphanomyces astaci]ETV76932.1 hypothetical protein, variant [Aphanomyces astaci]|eukprot:XP_009833843.1 hypothetical protein, variant [Aphanomyces astaci]